MIFENYDRTKFDHILIFQGGEKVEREVSELGIKVYVSNSLQNKISLKAFVDIYRILKENDINIIHTHLIKPYAIAGLISILLKNKFIFNYHGIFLKNNPYYSFIEKVIYSVIHNIIYIFNKVNVVLVPSKNSRELLMEETRLFPEPIVYYNGYNKNRNLGEASDDLINRIQTIKENKIIIALIGRLEIDKRVDRAINLMKTLLFHEKNLHLLIFGDGSQKDNLVHLADKLDLNSDIDFLGYLKEVQALYKFFDIVLFTSDWEGMPLTLWEAMANGVPVVAPDVGGFKEILEENNCGLIYEPANMKDAEEQLLKFITHKDLRKTLGNNGKIAIERRYTEAKFIDQLEKVYLDVIPE
jgi:glycosyltransferase involved in cell wall biosynthesis